MQEWYGQLYANALNKSQNRGMALQGKSVSGWNGQKALTLVAGGILPNIRAVPGIGQYPRCAKAAPCISHW